MKDLVANKQLADDDGEVRMNLRSLVLLENLLPPKENDPGSFILLCSIGILDFNNALADLGASISIMPFSMFRHLGIGKLKPINMVIEIADDTKCIPKGIVKNLLIMIDKFILLIDFIILDIIEDFRMPVILGRPLLATAHAKMNTEDDELMKIDSDLFTFNTNLGEINHLLSIDPDVFTYDIEVQESLGEVSETARDKILRDRCTKRFENKYDDSEEFEDPDRCKESKENKIL
ncbi:hypothetical protein Tco_0054281 [Tanacetum coccineum]